MSHLLRVAETAHIDTDVDLDRLAFSDPHRLLALATADSDSPVTVHRLNGERAFAIEPRRVDDDDCKPAALRWKPDGTLLAVTWTDDVCCLYSGESGKLLYELTVPDDGTDDTWSLHLDGQSGGATAPGAARTTSAAGALPGSIAWAEYAKHDRVRLPGDPVADTLVDDIEPGPQLSGFIDSIAALDTTETLPRLSRIDQPSGMRHTANSVKFSTQASTDVVFEDSKAAVGTFSTLLFSDRSGRLALFMDETIGFASFQLVPGCQISSASNTRGLCPSHASLARGTGNAVQLHYLDLPLERMESTVNHVITLNIKRLQSLVGYVTHAIRCIHHEIQIGIKGLPSRLVNSLNEEIRSNSASPGVDSTVTETATLELQRLALTSHFTPVMLEWLKDIVKETGHKRWDQAVNSMYDHIQSYIFKNLLPALQRFVAAVSALHAQRCFWTHLGDFHPTGDSSNYTILLQQTDALSLVAQRTLRAVTEEQSQFKAFSRWLRVMIDVAVAGPDSKNADETEHREAPNIDMDLCLRYIQGPLGNSLLHVLAESSPLPKEPMSRDDFFQHPIVAQAARGRTVHHLRTLDDLKDPFALRQQGESQAHPGDNINLPLLAGLLNARTRLATEAIEQWHYRGIRPTHKLGIDLNACVPDPRDVEKIYDMTMTPPDRSDPQTHEVVQVLAGPADGRGPLTLLRVSRSDHERIGIEIASGERVLHAAFDARVALLLTHQPPPDAAKYALYAVNVHSEKHPGRSTPVLRARAVRDWDGSGFLATPQRFVVGGTGGNRVVVVFGSGPGGSGGTRWEVFDLMQLQEGVGGV